MQIWYDVQLIILYNYYKYNTQIPDNSCEVGYLSNNYKSALAIALALLSGRFILQVRQDDIVNVGRL